MNSNENFLYFDEYYRQRRDQQEKARVDRDLTTALKFIATRHRCWQLLHFMAPTATNEQTSPVFRSLDAFNSTYDPCGNKCFKGIIAIYWTPPRAGWFRAAEEPRSIR